MPRITESTRLLACGLVALVISAFGGAQVSESASAKGATGSGDLKIKRRDGKKLTLHDWTLDGDTLRGTRDVWVEYEKVREPEAIALSDVILRDPELEGESLRTYLEAAQRASQDASPVAEPGVPHSPPPAPPEPAPRLRLRLDGTQHEGTLLRSSPDSLWLLTKGSQDTLRFARSTDLQVKTYNGSTSASGKGALIGGGVGLAAALGLIAAYSSQMDEPNPGGLVLGTVIFVAGGAVLGALFGSMIKQEQWVEASSLGFSLEASTESVRMSVGIGPSQPRWFSNDAR